VPNASTVRVCVISGPTDTHPVSYESRPVCEKALIGGLGAEQPARLLGKPKRLKDPPAIPHRKQSLASRASHAREARVEITGPGFKLNGSLEMNARGQLLLACGVDEHGQDKQPCDAHERTPPSGRIASETVVETYHVPFVHQNRYRRTSRMLARRRGVWFAKPTIRNLGERLV
jgi:hypothetical protein